jgi:hypothetical protein
MMNNTPNFVIDDPRYSVCRLQPEHNPALQKLMDACAGFMILVVGYPAQDAQVPEITKQSLGEFTTFLNVGL